MHSLSERDFRERDYQISPCDVTVHYAIIYFRNINLIILIKIILRLHKTTRLSFD